MGLKAKILTHVRCNMEDARLAVSTGVHGVDVVVRSLTGGNGHCPLTWDFCCRSGLLRTSESIPMERAYNTSSTRPLRLSSTQRPHAFTHRNAPSHLPCRYVKSQGKEIRFSSEDSFRSDLVDLLRIYSAVDKIGVTRVQPPGLPWTAMMALIIYSGWHRRYRWRRNSTRGLRSCVRSQS